MKHTYKDHIFTLLCIVEIQTFVLQMITLPPFYFYYLTNKISEQFAILKIKIWMCSFLIF